MSDINRALQYVEAIQREIDAWRSQQQAKGGQSVGRTGYQFPPSVAVMLEWHLREIRTSLAPEFRTPTKCPDCVDGQTVNSGGGPPGDCFTCNATGYKP
jgi:hypothetical protein